MTPLSSRRRPASRSVAVGLVAGLTLGLLGATGPAQAAADPVDGARTSGDTLFPNVGNGGYEVESYDINIAFTAAVPTVSPSSINATTTIKAETTGDPLSSFSLDFEGLTVNSVTVGGAPATFSRDSDTAAQKHKLIVTPTTPVSGDFTTVVQYSGSPVTHTDPDGSSEGWFTTPDGATALNEPVGAMTWFPNNNTPKDKATFDIRLDIPRLQDGEPMAAASNGELVSKTRNGARETWHWRQENQMATYLSMVSIGKYEVRESVINLAGGRKIRDWTFIDTAISQASRTATINNLALTQSIMQYLESKFGAYPGVSSGAVVDILPAGYALETQDRSFYPSSVSRGTLIHEIAHQWFGNAVSPTDWSDIWLNEGPGDYMPRLYNFATSFTTTSPETAYYNSWNSSSPASSLWSLPLAGFTNPSQLFNGRVYTRGGMTLETLRTTVGDDDWFEIMREWVSRNDGGDASTAEFIDLAEEIYGKDLTSLFAGWAYGTGKPAWPSRFTLDVSTDATAPVSKGDTVSHTLTAANTGRVPLTGATVVVDISDLVDDAIINPSAFPAGLELDGTTLTWTVPTTAAGQNATVTFDSVVRLTSSGGDIAVTATLPGLGAFCGTCSTSTATAEQPAEWLLGLSSDPASGEVDPGDEITYTLAVRNEGTAQLKDAEVEVDLADLLDDAELESLDDSLDLDGDTLTWDVPTTDFGDTSRVSFSAQVGDVSSATMTVTASPATEGGLGSPSVTHTVGEKPISPAPTPTIGGTAEVDETLTATAGDWREGTELSYQWSVGGAAVAGATDATYAVRPADVGKPVTVAVTGMLDGFAPVTKVSDPTAAVAPTELTRTSRVFIAGTPKVGRQLTINVGTWDAGVKHTYNWYRNGVRIGGANAKSYTLKKADQGKNIRGRVTTTKTGYVTVVQLTQKTPKVLK